MAKNINPEFQAAPFLGESSHDPIEFARRQKMLKYQDKERKRKEIEENTVKGLKNLMLDLKGWEDQEGFKEIVGDHDKVINAFMEFSKKGLNLTAPKTSAELTVFKAINDKLTQVKQKVDTWNEQKGLYDIYQKAIEADANNPKEEQTIDAEASYRNIHNVLKTTGILERKGKMENLIVTKPKIGDVHKYVGDNMEFLPKPDLVTEAYTDPDTGNVGSKSREIITPEFEKKKEEALRNLFKTAPEPIVNAISQTKAKDKLLDVMTDEDYFVSMYSPQFKQKMVDKISGAGGGLELNFGGQKLKIKPGEKHDERIPYGTKTYTGTYIFPATTKSFTVPIGSGGSEQFMGQSWTAIKEGTVEATLYMYDPAKDEFVFNTTSNQNAPWVQNNRPISIPRYILGDMADDLPITIDGKIRKLKDVFGPVKVIKKKLPIQWSGGIYLPGQQKTK